MVQSTRNKLWLDFKFYKMWTGSRLCSYYTSCWARIASNRPSTLVSDSMRKPLSLLASAIRGETLISVQPNQTFSTSSIADWIDESSKSTASTQIASNPPAILLSDFAFLFRYKPTTRYATTNDSRAFNTSIEQFRLLGRFDRYPRKLSHFLHLSPSKLNTSS